MEKDEFKKRIAFNIKHFRKAKNLTQKELAEKCGVHFQTIASIEMCRTWTSEANLIKIAEALEIDACEFFLPFEKNVKPIKDIVESNIKRIIQETYAECMAKNIGDYFTKDKQQEDSN